MSAPRPDCNRDRLCLGDETPRYRQKQPSDAERPPLFYTNLHTYIHPTQMQPEQISSPPSYIHKYIHDCCEYPTILNVCFPIVSLMDTSGRRSSLIISLFPVNFPSLLVSRCLIYPTRPEFRECTPRLLCDCDQCRGPNTNHHFYTRDIWDIG